MTAKSTITERCHCAYCDQWLNPGESHDWSKHPETIHGDMDRAREHRYGDTDE